MMEEKYVSGCSCSSCNQQIIHTDSCNHDHEHAHGHSVTGEYAAHRKSFLEIGIGALLLLAGFLLRPVNGAASIAVFVAGYLILGHDVLLSAARNIIKGYVFDENFLMSIATLAAFIIGEYPEAMGVMLFYRIGELFEKIAINRSRSQIMEVIDMRPEVVNLCLEDVVSELPAKQAKIGDILLVRPGDRIPLDGVVVQGESRIDTSPVTGEPVPVPVQNGSQVISGCVNTSGVLRMQVEKALADSMVTRILNAVENAAENKPKINRFITRFSRVYTPFIVVLALGTAIIPSLVTGSWQHWIYAAITFLVISCPCALVLSVPLAYFSGIGAGSREGVLFKGGLALEALEHVKAVVMDKTGTLTKGNFAIQKIVPLTGLSETDLLRLAANCEINSTHPIAGSIVAAAKNQELEIAGYDRGEEISGKGIKAELPEGTALCGSKALMAEYGIDLSNHIESHYGTEVLLALNGQLAGYMIIADIIKDDAPKAIADLKKKGLVPVMLTGDSGKNATAVGEATGITEVHDSLLPHEKVYELQKIRKNHGSVMYVGDGINDAPVLAGADVGAAMGSGADAAIEAADVVFMGSSMRSVPWSLSLAKATGRVARQNVVLALGIKALIMILAFGGYASMWMAVFADTGVAMICILNAIRLLYHKKM